MLYELETVELTKRQEAEMGVTARVEDVTIFVRGDKNMDRQDQE